MRLKSILAALAALAGLGIATADPTQAGGLSRTTAPHGWNETRTVHHWVYYPRYRHVYHVAGGDPYSYQYSTRGYYPYYNSNYWVAAQQMKGRTRTNYKLPHYYAAWGYPKHWHHEEWHAKNHGYHHRWHW